jgi:hypothetical protein
MPKNTMQALETLAATQGKSPLGDRCRPSIQANRYVRFLNETQDWSTHVEERQSIDQVSALALR